MWYVYLKIYFNSIYKSTLYCTADPEYKTAIAELNKSLNKTIDDFLVATEEAMKVCSMIIKKIDKKKDRSIILQHKDKLCQQVKETEDPAIILHLVVLILFTSCSNAIIHASGKFVSNILQYLQPHLNAEQNNILKQFHGRCNCCMYLNWKP